MVVTWGCFHETRRGDTGCLAPAPGVLVIHADLMGMWTCVLEHLGVGKERLESQER